MGDTSCLKLNSGLLWVSSPSLLWPQEFLRSIWIRGSPRLRSMCTALAKFEMREQLQHWAIGRRVVEALGQFSIASGACGSNCQQQESLADYQGSSSQWSTWREAGLSLSTSPGLTQFYLGSHQKSNSSRSLLTEPAVTGTIWAWLGQCSGGEFLGRALSCLLLCQGEMKKCLNKK